MPAYYRSAVKDFLSSDTQTIIGLLTSKASRSGFYQQLHSQTDSWEREIEILRVALKSPFLGHSSAGWSILLEFPIPRREKRADAVLLAGSAVLVLEFKCGAKEYARDAMAQVEDYCLDLRDFHVPSRALTIVPVLVASDAPGVNCPLGDAADGVVPVAKANASTLASVIDSAVRKFGTGRSINAREWDQGNYLPTPTIVEAAQHLYTGHNVREITRCHGGVENLARTSEAVVETVRTAQARNQKVICFVTGVPGAGKTLAGLNIVHSKTLHNGDLGVFLSGNGPLVKVLTEALARDHRARNGGALQSSRRRVSTFIQNVHRFIDEYYSKPDAIPPDKVIIFDEAQRAWDKEQSFRKFKRPFSEPELIMRIMDRHPDWSAVVCLVGSGQEINAGEAGLSEWGRAIASGFSHWSVVVSPVVLDNSYPTSHTLFETRPNRIQLRTNRYLHLEVSLRSYRAQALTEWVEAVLSTDRAKAASIARSLNDYPLVLTRSLDQARQWLRERHRGLRRIGLTASSGARRLRALGLDVTNVIDVEHWFLNPPEDVRSSYSLETVATEFDIQGLELDWTCVAWGGDLTMGDNGWVFRQFRGDRWQRVGSDVRRRYILNKYRVLLTRAREGMIIFVPRGSKDDHTRPPGPYDSVAAFLAECGLELLPDSV